MTRNQPSGQEMAVNVFAALGLSILWVSLIVAVLQRIDLSVLDHLPVFSVTVIALSSVPVVGGVIMASPLAAFLSSVVAAPLIEEALFRLLPLELASAFRNPRVIVAVQIAICGILFGYMHGHWFNVLIQGVLGFLASLVYLRNGAGSMRAGYLSCVALHAAYNFIVLATSM